MNLVAYFDMGWERIRLHPPQSEQEALPTFKIRQADLSWIGVREILNMSTDDYQQYIMTTRTSEYRRKIRTSSKNYQASETSRLRPGARDHRK